MLHAPSRSEYSEWTWRCATVGVLIGEGTIGAPSDRLFASAGTWAIRIPADVHLLLARRVQGRQCVRDLHRPGRLGADRGGLGGRVRGERDVGRAGRTAGRLGRADRLAMPMRGGAGGAGAVGGD